MSGPEVGDQTGRTVLVTGANSGIGLEAARVLAGRGAHVLLGCRDERRGRQAVAEVARGATGTAPGLVRLDLADLDDVERAAQDVTGRVDRLDVLVNNAGVMAVPYAETAQGHELQMGTNHLGHVALTARLLPLLREAPSPRVVTVSSLAHLRSPGIDLRDLATPREYDRWRRYADSKLANALFGFELQRRAEAAGLRLASVVVHPGWSATNLQSAPAQDGSPLRRVLVAAAMRVGNAVVAQDDRAGALPTLRAVSDPGLRGGEMIGPSGVGGLRGAPVLVAASGRARDPLMGSALWDASQRLVGVDAGLAPVTT